MTAATPIGTGPQKLREAMRPAPPRLPASASLEAARRAMHVADCDRVLVMDGERLAGAVTESDLLRRFGEYADCRCRRVGDVAGADVLTLAAETPVEEAAAAFRRSARRLIVVTDGGEVVGCVRPRDVTAPAAADVPSPKGVTAAVGELSPVT